ncbi:MAG: hypothetical protein NTZ32_16480 [Planctomycetales bacterium]|nr:hypothetical protein [Planctomycetales bacterium]
MPVLSLLKGAKRNHKVGHVRLLATVSLLWNVDILSPPIRILIPFFANHRAGI